MKIFFMKIISILCCVLFAFLPLSIPAFALELYDDVDDFAKIINIDNVEKIVLDSESLDNMSRKMKRLSDREKVDMLLERFDMELFQSTKQYNEMIDNFDDIESISASMAYIKVDEYGNQTVISKEECLKALKSESVLQRAGSISDIFETVERESSNGYMLQTIMAIYDRKEPKGTYGITCSSKWLKTPMVRTVDAMSISSRELKWSKNIEDYAGLAGYDRTTRTHNGNSITEKTEQVLVELKEPLYYDEEKGVAYKWYLPVNTSYVSGGYGVSNSYSEFGTIITGKARVKDYNKNNQMISVDYRYLHVQMKIDIDKIVYEWMKNQFNKWYITLVKNISFVQKNYDYSHTWNYSKHANL